MEFKHISVLLNESISMLRVRPDGIYVDGTLGGGGHASLICSELDKKGRLIGIDRDQTAINAAAERLRGFPCDVTIVHNNFFNIRAVLDGLEVSEIDGAVLDLGVSSPQLDDGARGFSYHQDARLDMRMDQSAALDAEAVVNGYDEAALADIIFRYGEEKFARRIAKNIVIHREEKRIETTFELSEIIKQAFPASARYADKHPAKRTFQAIRIEVNHELEGLRQAATDFVDALKPGGRLAVITFHSLEDRMIKQTFVDLATGCKCPKDFPICVCGNKAKVRLVNRKPIVAGVGELGENSRAHSAKLRVVERVEG